MASHRLSDWENNRANNAIIIIIPIITIMSHLERKIRNDSDSRSAFLGNGYSILKLFFSLWENGGWMKPKHQKALSLCYRKRGIVEAMTLLQRHSSGYHSSKRTLYTYSAQRHCGRLVWYFRRHHLLRKQLCIFKKSFPDKPGNTSFRLKPHSFPVVLLKRAIISHKQLCSKLRNQQ